MPIFTWSWLLTTFANLMSFELIFSRARSAASTLILKCTLLWFHLTGQMLSHVLQSCIKIFHFLFQ